MGIDNVLAIAGRRRRAITGLVDTWFVDQHSSRGVGSTLILKLIERFPIIIYAGAGAIAWTAGRMISHESSWFDWFTEHGWMKHALEVVLVIGICEGVGSSIAALAPLSDKPCVALDRLPPIVNQVMTQQSRSLHIGTIGSAS